MILIIKVAYVRIHQALKVNQVSQETRDVQGLTDPKGKEETPVMEANLDHKVNPRVVRSRPRLPAD